MRFLTEWKADGSIVLVRTVDGGNYAGVLIDFRPATGEPIAIAIRDADDQNPIIIPWRAVVSIREAEAQQP